MCPKQDYIDPAAYTQTAHVSKLFLSPSQLLNAATIVGKQPDRLDVTVCEWLRANKTLLTKTGS